MNDRQTPFDVESLRPRRPPATPPAPVPSSSRDRVDSRDERALVTYVAHITFARPLVPATSNYRANLVSVSSNESPGFYAQHIGPRRKNRAGPFDFSHLHMQSLRIDSFSSADAFTQVGHRVLVSGSRCARDFRLTADGVYGFNRTGWVGRFLVFGFGI